MNTNTNYESVIMTLEERIRDGQFQSKEELADYINFLKQQGISSDILSQEKEVELLNTYDELHPTEENALNTENYKGVELSDQNVIVSKQDDTLLKTDSLAEELQDEFRENQNELTAMGENGLANADEVFDYMQEYKKEEYSLMPINEAIGKENVDSETLNKIKFFVTNKNIEPYNYQVDIEKGIFYNVENQEVLEVRKNEQTNQYEIYKGNELAYNSNSESLENKNDINTEAQTYENENVKVRRLIKPKDNHHLDNAAFVRSSLLFGTCILISLILSIIIGAIYK